MDFRIDRKRMQAETALHSIIPNSLQIKPPM